MSAIERRLVWRDIVMSAGNLSRLSATRWIELTSTSDCGRGAFSRKDRYCCWLGTDSKSAALEESQEWEYRDTYEWVTYRKNRAINKCHQVFVQADQITLYRKEFVVRITSDQAWREMTHVRNEIVAVRKIVPRRPSHALRGSVNQHPRTAQQSFEIKQMTVSISVIPLIRETYIRSGSH